MTSWRESASMLQNGTSYGLMACAGEAAAQNGRDTAFERMSEYIACA